MADSFSPAVERAVLPPGYRLIHHASIDSTNLEALRLCARGALDRTIVQADAQTAGRGRRGRSWASPPGNLYCSIILRPAISVAEAGQLSFLTAVALAETIGDQLGAVTLKWPNDVLLDEAKLAGILLEASGGATLDAVVIGIGVNLASAPDGLSYATTCLAARGDTPPSPTAFLGRLASHLEVWIRRWESLGFAPVRVAWLSRAGRLGRPMTVSVGERRTVGAFAGLADDGALMIETADGVTSIHAGDVTLGR